MRRHPHPVFLIGSLLTLLASQVLPVEAQKPAVRAVLFYSPSCPHCHLVISEHLPALIEKYGDQLQVIGVDTTQPGGGALYQATIERYGIPEERQGVPTLVIADVVLVGSLEIPQQLPGLVEKYLAKGGADWPDIPGLAEALVAARPTTSATAVHPTATATAVHPTATATSVRTLTSTPPLTTAPTSLPSGTPAVTPTPTRAVVSVTGDGLVDWRAELARDPAGNALALAALLGMALVMGNVLLSWPPTAGKPAAWQSYMVPLLASIGLGVAGYMSYVETLQVAAVCGPVGDCNTVQQSPYAWLLGLIPIGVLGLVGYATIVIAWAMGHYGHGPLAWLALMVMTLFGTLFSMYLTFLEPFVIGATCAWCLTSAVIMTTLLGLIATPGKQAALALFAGSVQHAGLDEEIL